MPGSLSVPYTEVLTADGRLRTESDVRAVFAKAGVDLAKPIVNSCGSGVTAAVLALAQSFAGHDDAAVYDASWSEWGKPETATPVATG
jgi:thiosulfate/3-mercaptopyruvate sulfurtransferase